MEKVTMMLIRHYIGDGHTDSYRTEWIEIPYHSELLTTDQKAQYSQLLIEKSENWYDKFGFYNGMKIDGKIFIDIQALNVQDVEEERE